MGLWKKIFAKNTVTERKQPDSPDLSKIKWALNNHLTCTALWLAANHLKSNRDSRPAREIYVQALAFSSAGWAKMLARVDETGKSALKLLKRRNMSPEEAKITADFMISLTFVKLVRTVAGPLVERINKGEISPDVTIPDSDLDSSCILASLLVDEFPEEHKGLVNWESPGKEQAAPFITATTSALVALLQANCAADWENACMQIQIHFSEDPALEEAANSFREMGKDELSENEFQERWNSFTEQFPKDIVEILLSANGLRKPTIGKTN